MLSRTKTRSRSNSLSIKQERLMHAKNRLRKFSGVERKQSDRGISHGTAGH